MSFLIEVNNKLLEVKKGELLLDVLRRNNINIPTLCYMKDFFPNGACRMCVVENETTGKLITACSYPVEEGMKIQTHSPRVVESRKTIVELLLANHPDDCLYCVRNKNCELQSLAKNLNVKTRRLEGERKHNNIDRSSPSIIRDPDKCILCGRCVTVCEEVMGVSAIDFTYRGSSSNINTAFGKGLNVSSCVNCGQCIMVCPTGAITEKSHIEEIQSALYDNNKIPVIQYAPAITVSLAEEFGLPAGLDLNGKLNAALRKMGFKYVFDTSFSADLTIMEESAELIERVQSGGTLPMFTSCCPAWIKFAEEFAEDFLPGISSCKSPQQMLGAIIKSYWAEKTNHSTENIYSVSIMPCTAKKFEAQREEMTMNGISDIDAVLTTRELAQMIRMYGIDLTNLDDELTDSPLGFRSSAGKLFAGSGGVMEAAIRTAYKKLTGEEMIKFKVNEIRGLKGRKETKLNINGLEIGIAVVSGLANAKKLLDEIRNGRKDLHFIEVMACPGGCINGGGQPIGAEESDIMSRLQMLYDIDDKDSVKVSHQNPEVQKLYDEFLVEPLGHKSHELLHTHYAVRKVIL